MKSLKTLLRVAKRDLEMLRRALAEQIAKQTSIEQAIAMLAQSVADEQKNALKDFEAARAYGAFAVHAVARRRARQSELTTAEEAGDRLRVLINEAHVEVRKFERLIELQEERDRAAAAKREVAELDELATQRAGRFSPR
jgi:flagellar export protein FliJ